MRKPKNILITSIILIIAGVMGITSLLLFEDLLISTSTVPGRVGITSNGQILTFEDAETASVDYLNFLNLQNLKIKEIMEFSGNFYIEVIETDTGMGAMELLIDKTTGSIFPEYGPNMMWNLKYGMPMHRRVPITTTDIDMPIDEDTALKLAGDYLNRINLNEIPSNEVEKFYGYYTIHTLDNNGEIAGMLSINGYSEAAWYHDWHGTFISMKEYE